MNIQFSVGRRLYLSVMAVFFLFAAAFIVFQQRREKQFKIDTLTLRLQNYNERMHEALDCMGSMSEATLEGYVAGHRLHALRVTCMTLQGRVFFDNQRKDYAHIGNHATRKEVAQALKTGQGVTIDRQSTTTKGDYFYVATYFPQGGYIVRSALPYDNDLAKSLSADQHYLWFALGALVLLTALLYRFVNRLGENITKLTLFATRADHNESLDTDDLLGFPDDELGEIAERIIKLYKRLQRSRHEQDRLKRQLTQNIAHELKTPVAGIQGYLETILSHEQMDEATRRQFLERSYAQSKRLGALLSDISTLNRMDDAPQLMDFQTVDIASLVADIVRETALQLDEHGMVFHNLLPAHLPIEGNRELLYSVFRNLTDNAVAYAGHGTAITLAATREPEAYRFVFSDNGPGVAKEHLPRLFERFYRVDKGRSRKMGGTGLGLAIVKNAVLMHGGTIKVENAGGLRFEFTMRISHQAADFNA